MDKVTKKRSEDWINLCNLINDIVPNEEGKQITEGNISDIGHLAAKLTGNIECIDDCNHDFQTINKDWMQCKICKDIKPKFK